MMFTGRTVRTGQAGRTGSRGIPSPAAAYGNLPSDRFRPENYSSDCQHEARSREQGSADGSLLGVGGWVHRTHDPHCGNMIKAPHKNWSTTTTRKEPVAKMRLHVPAVGKAKTPSSQRSECGYPPILPHAERRRDPSWARGVTAIVYVSELRGEKLSGRNVALRQAVRRCMRHSCVHPQTSRCADRIARRAIQHVAYFDCERLRSFSALPRRALRQEDLDQTSSRSMSPTTATKTMATTMTHRSRSMVSSPHGQPQAVRCPPVRACSRSRLGSAA